MYRPENMQMLRTLTGTLRGFWVLACCFSSAWNDGTNAADNSWFDIARTSITTVELQGHVAFLADDSLEGREAGSRGGHAAAKYLLDHLQDLPVQPAGTDGGIVQRFQGQCQNLLVMLPGSDPQLAHEFILVGAHYDHVGYGNRRNSYGPFGFIHNGADDNASGVAALLELIDALTRTEHRLQRSLLFAFWDGEEQGLLGSEYWRNQPTVPIQDVKLSINVDMVGRLTHGRLELGGTRSGSGLRRLMSSRLLAEGWVDFTWDFKNNSDHWTFQQAGIPSLYVHTGLHTDYHRPSDDIEKINTTGIQLVTTYLLEQVTELADAEQLPTFRSESGSETPFAQRRFEQPLPPLASRLSFACRADSQPHGDVIVDQVFDAGVPLLPGDQILAVDGEPLTDVHQLQSLALAAEGMLELTVARAGEDTPLAIQVPLAGSPVRLGISWRDDPAEPQAVMVSRVVPHSPAERAGLQVGDRILGCEGRGCNGRRQLLQEVQQLLSAKAKQICFEVESRGVIHQVVADLKPQPAADDSSL
jgi:hypothetical protein